MKCFSLLFRKRPTQVFMIIVSHYDKKVVRMRKICENGIIPSGIINKIGRLVDKWWDFGYVTIQSLQYFMKYTPFLSEVWLTQLFTFI